MFPIGTVVTYFPRKEPDSTSIEVAQVADVENAILNDVLNIRHPSDVCTSVYDLAALITYAATTTLLARVKHPDFQFTSLYHTVVGELVRHPYFTSSSYTKGNLQRQKHIAALASFRDQDLQMALGDVAQDAREENYELSLVVDANALKDELQGLSGIIQAQRGILMRFENSIRNSADENGMESTSINLLKAASDKLRLFEAEFESLRADAEAIERDVSNHKRLGRHAVKLNNPSAVALVRP